MSRILATAGNTVPLGRSLSFTGRTKQMYSPLQKRLVTYDESFTIRITSPKGSPPDLESIKSAINTDVAGQNIDAQCDSVMVIQGAVQDSYKFRTWIAEEQPTQPAGTKGLIADWIILAIFLAITTAVIIGVVIFAYCFMAIATPLMPSKPKYTGGTPTDPKTFDDYAQYLSYQNTLYWYVCPTCGAGFGLKTSYPNVSDVPAEEKAAFDEHVAICQGIPQTNYDTTGLIVWAIVGASLVAFIVWGAPKIIGSLKGKK